MEQQQEEAVPGESSCQVAREQCVKEMVSSTVSCCRGHVGKGQVEKCKGRITSMEEVKGQTEGRVTVRGGSEQP